MRVFVSYARKDRPFVETLVDDLHKLGHDAWFDEELSGGQSWWNEILRRIQNCEAFVAVVSARSVNSQACHLEANYAAALQRPILPLRVDPDVSIAMLPKVIAERQFVDYINRDADSTFNLVRGFNVLPTNVPLPEQLPEPPAVPISYLTSLAEAVDAASLEPDRQVWVLAQLKARIVDEEQRDDVVGLLRRLRTRADVLASVRDEADGVLREAERQKERESHASSTGAIAPPPPAPNAWPRGWPDAAVHPGTMAPPHQVPTPPPPPSGQGVAAAAKPPNYMVQAVLVTLLFFPLGIVSIVKASQVNAKWGAGDMAGAQKASRQAKQWAWAALVVGIIFAVLYAMGASSTNSSDF